MVLWVGFVDFVVMILFFGVSVFWGVCSWWCVYLKGCLGDLG